MKKFWVDAGWNTLALLCFVGAVALPILMVLSVVQYGLGWTLLMMVPAAAFCGVLTQASSDIYWRDLRK